MQVIIRDEYCSKKYSEVAEILKHTDIIVTHNSLERKWVKSLSIKSAGDTMVLAI